MKLEGKKVLASKALGVGKERIVFNTSRLSEIKEAITKQDMKDLYANKAIFIKQPKGRRKIQNKKSRRNKGKIRKVVKKSKRNYIILTRKFRRHISELRNQEKISQEEFIQLRKEIRNREFITKSQLKERILSIKNV